MRIVIVLGALLALPTEPPRADELEDDLPAVTGNGDVDDCEEVDEVEEAEDDDSDDDDWAWRSFPESCFAAHSAIICRQLSLCAQSSVAVLVHSRCISEIS